MPVYFNMEKYLDGSQEALQEIMCIIYMELSYT